MRQQRRAGVSSIVGSIFFILIMVVAIGSLVTMFNSFTAYNQQVNKASNSNLAAADTKLSVTSGQFGAFPPSAYSNFNVATACTATATSPTNREKVFYTANMWWNFYTCNGAFQYSTSFDGDIWSAETSVPSLITSGYTVGPYFDVEVSGTTLYLAIAKVGVATFELGVGTLAQGGTDSAPAGTITWTQAPTNVATTEPTLGPINMGIDAAGNQWVVVAQDNGATGCTTATNCALAVYEHEACATGSGNGWEPNACNSATAPTNYAPTAFAGIGTNVHTIVEPAISSYSTTGVMVLFESGSATAGTSGWLVMETQTALASTAWTAMTLPATVGTTSCSATLICYSLTSSSGALVGTSFYFAGLGATTAGATTGNVYFWSLSFSSMTADTASTPTEIETGAATTWMAALAFDGTTLALFDNPAAAVDSCPATDVCVQYYTSSNLGASWSSAILLESAETAVTYLAPADGALAVTWTNTADNVRFAALSTFTVSNSSPSSVHIVDAYVYNPSTNTLIAHWYYNTTGTGAEDFDWWVGQGASMVIPLRFVWAASTSYLITFSTDTGVTTQTTLTTLPGGTVSCPSGQFFNEISPYDLCATSPGDTNPYLTSGPSAASCEPSTAAAWYMGFDMAYTTQAATSGNLYASFTFEIDSITSVATATWQLVYGAGTAPTCEAAASYTGSATTLGEAFTIEAQSATANEQKEHSQSVSVTLSNLAPSTTYWFDIEGTPATASTWTFSNPDAAIVDVLSSNAPTLATSEGTSTCTDATTTTPEMMAFDRTFTTGGTGFSGTVFGELAFDLANPTTTAANIDTVYTVRYGTGTAPTCNNGAASGTAVPGNSFEVMSQNTAEGQLEQKVSFVLTGLTASTTYWVDVESADSNADHWTYSDPVLSTMNMPNAGTNSLPAAAETSTATTCTDSTSAIPEDAGLGLKYAIPSSATGDLFVSLTFQVTTPAAEGANEFTTWQAAYGTGATPACNEYGQGTQAGSPFILNSEAANTDGGEWSQSESFVIQNVQRLAGTTIWIDVQTIDGSTAEGWVIGDGQLAVAYFPE